MLTNRLINFFAAGLGIGILSLSCVLQAESLDRIVAVVDEEAITLEELNQKLARALQNVPQEQRAQLPPMDDLKVQILDQLINLKLEWKLAQAAHIKLPPNTLNRAIRSVAERNRFSLEQLKKAIKAAHLDWDNWKTELEKELKIEHYEQSLLLNQIDLSDAEIQAEIQRIQTQIASSPQQQAYRIAHLLIGLPESVKPQLRKKAEQIAHRYAQQLKTHQTTIEQILDTQSLEDPLSLSGGDLGLRTIEQIPSLFAGSLKDLKAGDVAEVLKSPAGFHVFTLVETQGSNQPVNIDPEDVRQKLSQAKYAQLLDEWRHTIRNEAHVDIRL